MTEAAFTADEVVTEALRPRRPAAKVVAEAAFMLAEVVAEATSTADEAVAEDASTADEGRA